jgi:hypothetical protein
MVKVSAWKVGSTRNQEKRKESSLAYCRFRSQNVPLIITGNDHTQTQLITAPIKWTVVQRETTRTHTQSRITRISFFLQVPLHDDGQDQPPPSRYLPYPIVTPTRWTKTLSRETHTCTHMIMYTCTRSTSDNFKGGQKLPIQKARSHLSIMGKLPFTRLNPHVHTLRVEIPVRQARTLSLSWDKTPSHWG